MTVVLNYYCMKGQTLILNSKTTNLLVLLSIILFMILNFIYTQDLIQVNSESVFLTKQGLDKYQNYQDSHNIKSVVIAKFENMNLLEKEELLRQQKDSISYACEENDCRFILPLELPKGSEELLPLTSSNSFASILIDENHGEDIKGMIENLSSKSFFENSKKRIKFGGIPYTNMKLDEYSKKVSKKSSFPYFLLRVLS